MKYCIACTKWRENHTRLHIRVGREIIRSKKRVSLGPKQNWKSNFILNRATVRLKKGLLDLRNSDFVSLADSIMVSQILNVNRHISGADMCRFGAGLFTFC